MPDFAALNEIAAAQLTCFTRAQAHEFGVDSRILLRRIRDHQYRELTSRVLVPVSTPVTDKIRARAATLHIGGDAAATQYTGSAAWGIPGFRYAPLHVLSSRAGRGQASGAPLRIEGRLVVPHTTTYLPPHHVVDLNGLPVLTPTRLLFSLSTCIHPGRLARLVDWAWARRYTNGPLLHTTFAELERRGRGRITVMRAILDSRGLDYIPPESNLEARIDEQLARRGLGPYDRQVDLGDEFSWLARVDFGHRFRKVVIEVDGDLHHLALADKQADERRAEALRRAGYEVVRITEFEVWHDIEPAMARVRKAELRAPLRVPLAA